MAINLNNLFNSINKNSKMGDFQDLEHIDGLSISTTSANLYSKQRDDLVLFYFRNGANHASVYTQSKLISENIKWNLKINKKKIKALLINTRNANAFTGKDGFKGLKILADSLSQELTQKQKIDEEGFLTLKDRSKDVIISGGSNIYPREVEEVILKHAHVAEVSVIGRPNAEWGEDVIAFVVCQGDINIIEGELDQLCIDNIARFKRPKEYRFVNQLPKNNYGKVLKTQLREMV